MEMYRKRWLELGTGSIQLETALKMACSGRAQSDIVTQYVSQQEEKIRQEVKMRIKSSQVRSLAQLWPEEEQVTASRKLKAIFPEAFAWKKIPSENLRFTPYKFDQDEVGVEIVDVLVYPGSGQDSGRVVKIGVYRPGKGEQEFKVDNYCYKVSEALKDGTFSVWRCEE